MKLTQLKAGFNKQKKQGYRTISEKDVVDILFNTSESWEGYGVITPSNIVQLLNTSRYQVDKHMKSLKSKGLLDYKSVSVSTNDELYPPINGYCLSNLGKKTFRKELENLRSKRDGIIQRWFKL